LSLAKNYASLAFAKVRYDWNGHILTAVGSQAPNNFSDDACGTDKTTNKKEKRSEDRRNYDISQTKKLKLGLSELLKTAVGAAQG